jgi:Right handed beta helix region
LFDANASGADRTWVSGTTGADTGTCPISAPCASFSYALSQTATGGEIDCLTPGNFGIVTIDKSVSVICDGVSNGGILSTGGTTAITINGTSGTVVYLSGLDLQCVGCAGAFGVTVNSGSTVYVIHSTIRNFGDYGVNVESTTNPTRVIIKDSTIVANGSGVFVDAQSGATNVVAIVNTLIDGNEGAAVGASGASSYLSFVQSLLTGSPVGLSLVNGANGEFIGPSNTVSGDIIGSPTSVDYK